MQERVRNMLKKITSFIVLSAIILGVFASSIFTSLANTYPAEGTVIVDAGNKLNLRAAATTSSASLAQILSGTVVTVTGETTGTVVNGSNKWYQVTYGTISGYAHSDYIYVTPKTPGDSEDFEASLASQNFPESYKVYLRALHKKYPNWKFVAEKIVPTWSTVLNAEFGKEALISKNETAAWKTFDKGYYDFSTGTHTTFDGGAYHAASLEYLKYCLDPRNFLNETYIFMFMRAYGQTDEAVSGVTNILSGLNWAKTYPDNDEIVYFFEDGTYKIVSNKDVKEESSSSGGTSSDSTSSAESSSENTSSGDSSSGTSSEESSSDTSSDNTSSEDETIEVGDKLDGKVVKEIMEIDSYGKAFIAANKISGISAYMLASRVRQEQGVNGNPSGMGKVTGYEGYYNFWNIKTSGDDKYLKGAQYAKEKGWDTPLKSIIGGSEWINTNYFQAGQDTLYLQKFDIVAGGNGYYWHQYMTYLPAPQDEALILKRGFTAETLQNEAVFKIPVYTGMPETPPVCPSRNGTNNNYLKNIEVKDYTLSTSFDVYTYSYETIVENKSDKVQIIATPYDSTAKVTGGGEVELEVGNNVINLEVTASNGAKRNYKLIVFRKEPDPVAPEEPKLEITGTEYQIGDYVTKIEPETSAAVFIEKFTVKNGSVKLFGLDKNEKLPESFVATGDEVVLYDTEGVEQLRYSIVIYGDVNSDGKVNSIDLLVAQRHIVGLSVINDIQVVAGNSNKDTKLNSVDLLITQRFIVGLTASIQGS